MIVPVPVSRRAARVLTGALALGLALPLATLVPAHAATPRWLVVNARKHTATLTLIAGYNGALGGLNFDGYGDGKMTVSVPRGYRVTVVFSNKGDAPHSVVIVPFARKDAQAGYTPAFRGAATPDHADGSMGSKTMKFSFVASKAGAYAIVCGVPGHAGAGMWDKFKVTKGGHASLTTKA